MHDQEERVQRRHFSDNSLKIYGGSEAKDVAKTDYAFYKINFGNEFYEICQRSNAGVDQNQSKL